MSLRRRWFSEPILARVDPETGEFSATGLPPDVYDLGVWVPGVGLWMVQKVRLLPGERAEVPLRLPTPGSLHVRVDLPEGARRDQLAVSLRTVAFIEGGGRGGPRRLQESHELGLLTVDVFPGQYDMEVFLAGIRYEFHPVQIEPGRTTHETVSLLGAIPMTLHVSLDRRLRARESVSLSIVGGALQRDLPLRTVRRGRSIAYRVFLTRDTKELRVETSLGLSGRLTVTEADIVRDGVLRMSLREPGDR